MKNLLVLFFLLLAIGVHAQVISGIYVGKIDDDPLRKKQTYELALNEYRGKIMGYSYSSFVKNDTFYYCIRNVKARREQGTLIVEDDKILVHNFPQAPDKRVHRTSVIQLTNEDTLRTVKGSFSTNKTKEFYSIKGALLAPRETDSTRSALIGHLRELNVLGNDRGGGTETAGAKIQEEKKPEPKPVKNKTDKVMAATNVKSPEPALPLPFTQRQNRVQQIVDVQSDSLVLSFYDNGVIDGDSISVYLNGALIIGKTKLLSTATRKTVAVPFGDVELKLVAENLGELPPNTGLLVIRDGEAVYNVNFSADLHTNASIILKRKR